MRKRLKLIKKGSLLFGDQIQRYNNKSIYPMLCKDKLHEYFDLPKNIKTMWLEISDKKMKESYRININRKEHKLYIEGNCIYIPMSMFHWVSCNVKSNTFYARILY